MKGSKSIIRNNLVCASILKFTLFRTFENIAIDLDLERKDVSNKLLILGSDRKNSGISPFVEKR